MAVKIPKVQRIAQGRDVPQTTRINQRVSDQSSTITSRTNTIKGFAEAGADIYQQYENDKIKQLSYEAEKEAAGWTNEKLKQLKSYEGDPTDAFANFEKEQEDFYKQTLDKRSDASERVKSHLKMNMDRVRDNLETRVMQQRGGQIEIYKNNLYTDTIKLRRNDLASSVGSIEIGDPTSAIDFNQGINSVREVVLDRGLERGSVQEVPEGQHNYKKDGKFYKLAPSAQVDMAKEVSLGVRHAIESLTVAGEMDKANAVYEDYNKLLDVPAKKALNIQLKKKNTKVKASTKYAEIQFLSEDKQVAAIEKIRDPEERDAVYSLKQRLDRRREIQTEKKQDANFEVAMKRVDELREAGAIFGVDDIIDDPAVAKVYNNLSVKQQRSLREIVEIPKKTDPKAMAQVQEFFLGQNPKYNPANIPPEKFQELLNGLDESDRRTANTRFLSMRKPKSNKTFTTHKKAAGLLKSKLIAKELVKFNKYGKISGKDKNKLEKANDDLIEYLDEQGVTDQTTVTEIDEHLEEYVKKAQKEKLFGGGTSFWSKLFSSDDEEVAVQAPKNNPLKGLNKRQIFQLQREYKDEFGNIPKNDDPAFLNWASEQ